MIVSPGWGEERRGEEEVSVGMATSAGSKYPYQTDDPFTHDAISSPWGVHRDDVAPPKVHGIFGGTIDEDVVMACGHGR
jgi:hypothetical protein